MSFGNRERTTNWQDLWKSKRLSSALSLLSLDHPMRFLVGLTLVFPLAAFGQSLTLKVNGVGDTSGAPALTTNRCSDAFQVNATLTGQVCSGPTYWITTSSSCGDSPSSANFDLTFDVDSFGNRTIAVSDLPFFRGADGGVPCPRAATQDHKVCGSFTTPSSLITGCSSTTVVHQSSAPTIQWKGAPAAVPSIDSVSPRDGAIGLGLSITGTDALLIRIEVAVSGTGQFAEVASISATQPSYNINGLTNNVAYDIQVRSEDTIGNLSAYSPIATGTPVASAGFFDAYRQAGGQDLGGCGGLGAILLAFCLPAVVWGALARRKR